jgi:hypothetical protein
MMSLFGMRMYMVRLNKPAQPSEKLLAFARSVENYSQSHDIPWTISRHLVNFEAKVKEENTAAYCFTLPDYNWPLYTTIFKITFRAPR